MILVVWGGPLVQPRGAHIYISVVCCNVFASEVISTFLLRFLNVIIFFDDMEDRVVSSSEFGGQHVDVSFV